MGAEPIRMLLPDWPRLMAEPQAAAYLSISTTTLRQHGPTAKRQGRRVLYDRRDLDRWADSLSEQPLTDPEQAAESADVERRWREKRQGRATN